MVKTIILLPLLATAFFAVVVEGETAPKNHGTGLRKIPIQIHTKSKSLTRNDFHLHTKSQNHVEAQSDDCTDFSAFMLEMKYEYSNQEAFDGMLDDKGYWFADNIFGTAPTYEECTAFANENGELYTYAGQRFVRRFDSDPETFATYVAQCGGIPQFPPQCIKDPKTPPKYRTIDGRYNNPYRPDQGASDTPFARVAPNGYEDRVNIPCLAESGNPLPSPRLIVTEVLQKLTRKEVDTSLPVYSTFALGTVLFITHDVHYQAPKQPKNESFEMQCCTDDESARLPRNETHSACYPIRVPKGDPVYGPANISCLNFVRSIKTEQPKNGTCDVENLATSYLDVSLIYGNHKSECDAIRSFSNGKLRMDQWNVLPVDKTGNYLPSMRRFTASPFSVIWPSMFAQNHNILCAGLAKVNPCWGDEKLFQEARRMMIAGFQANLVTSRAVQDSISGIPINDTRDVNKDPSCTLEFALAYRAAHYYLPDDLTFEYANGTEYSFKQSDAVGKNYLWQERYFDLQRGLANNKLNFGPFGQEITSRLGKNTPDGLGEDIISIDIQRGRDQGQAPYLAVRKALNLTPVIETWDDLYNSSVMYKDNVLLLKKVYENPWDIDYYVAVLCEMMSVLGQVLMGPTPGRVIGDQWDRFSGGDSYYYLNPNSPYPFTAEQIKAIQDYSVSNMLCAMGLNETQMIWPYVTDPIVNPIIPCSFFPPMNFTVWKQKTCVDDLKA